jgi:hypothetical protein
MANSIASAKAALAQAAQRPHAGFGAGAFTCDGDGVGSGAEMAAALALPRIKWAVISRGHAQPGFVLGATTSLAQTSPVPNSPVLGGVGQAYTEQIEQTTRINPVAPGGLGPHPAREPDPV